MQKIKSHIETAMVVGSIIGGLFFLDSRDESRSNDLKSEMRIQSQRTDRLYEMFIKLLQERK